MLQKLAGVNCRQECVSTCPPSNPHLQRVPGQNLAEKCTKHFLFRKWSRCRSCVFKGWSCFSDMSCSMKCYIKIENKWVNIFLFPSYDWKTALQKAAIVIHMRIWYALSDASVTLSSYYSLSDLCFTGPHLSVSYSAFSVFLDSLRFDSYQSWIKAFGGLNSSFQILLQYFTLIYSA